MDQDKETSSCVFFCGNNFRQKFLLKIHVLIHNGVRRIFCDECEFSCISEGGPNIHKQSEHEGITFQCYPCEFSHKPKHQLGIHISVKHEGLEWLCDKCDFSTENGDSLRLHILKSH